MKNADPYLKHINGMRIRQSTFDRWQRNESLRLRELELNPRKEIPSGTVRKVFVNKKRSARAKRRAQRLLRFS